MVYDVAIIGAGVTGTLAAMELVKYEVSVCIIEREPEASMGSSAANSGIVHAGYDAVPGTQKAEFNTKGCKMIKRTAELLDIPYKNTGSLVIGFNKQDKETIDNLYDRGIKNSIEGMSIIGHDEIMKIEPNVNKKVQYALYAKTAGIISPYKLAIAAAETAVQNGCELKCENEVKGIKKEKGIFLITTNKEVIKSRYVVNAAGLYSDTVARFAGDDFFTIKPRRGEYMLLDKKAGQIVNHIIFQTPSEKGKGILVTPTVEGNLLLGPNAVDIDNKEDDNTTRTGLDEVKDGSVLSVPNIDFRMVITQFAGLRATPSTKDFIICESKKTKGFIHAAGIESPGLTASSAIAIKIVKLLKKAGLNAKKNINFDPKRKETVNIAKMDREKAQEMILKNPAYGNIVCRCETVSEGEIIDAIRRPAGARTIDGVKRRTRAGMGRCQGGFCMPKVLEILSRELNIEINRIQKSGEGSYVIYDLLEKIKKGGNLNG